MAIWAYKVGACTYKQILDQNRWTTNYHLKYKLDCALVT
jgi:hypothetical protein